MFPYKKSFSILSAVSIALNFLFLSFVLKNKANLIENSYPETTEQSDVSFSSSSSISPDIQGSASKNNAESVSQKGYDKAVFLTELSQYSDIILPYTADKADDYLQTTLFIGDSNTAGLASFGYMPLQNVLGKKSMGIQGVTSNNFVWFRGYSQPVTIVNAVKLLKPRRIIINFGTNNTIGTTATEFKSMYLKALNAISRAYPYCDIIVSAVLPIGYYRENYSIKQETIDTFNIALAQICSEQGYWFLDYTEAFKDDQTGYMLKSCVASDGIHLNDKGYRLLLEYINDHQLITNDNRPDTDNIPRRINAPQNEAATTVIAEAENIPSDSFTEQSDETVFQQDIFSASSDTSTIGSGTDTSNEHLSDSSSDFDIINSEKPIYDPFI